MANPIPAYPNAPGGPESRLSGLAVPLALAIFSRLLLNTARRLAYPFAPALSRGLDVPLTAITSVIAANQVTGLLGIFIGPLADRLGYKRMMLAGIGILALAMLAAGALPRYAVVFAALLLAGLGKTLFDPAIQAYIGERVPFQRRAAIIGLAEFSWAGSALLGIPAVGLLMQAFGWRAPLFAIGLLALVGAWSLALALPADTKTKGFRGSAAGLLKAWRRLARERVVLGAVGFGFFISFANDNLFVVCGAWFEASFGLSIAALGLSMGAIGAAELAGEFMTVMLGDRIGIQRSATLGLALSAAAYLLLPMVAGSMVSALCGLFVIFLLFEFTIVSFISLGTELLPDSRAATMSFVFAAAGAGRVAGALAGGPVWLAGGILATGLISAALTILALVSLLLGLKGWKPQSLGA